MVDNVTSSGGDTFKTDEDTVDSSHVPITKIELGAENSFDGYVSSTNPMPVGGSGSTLLGKAIDTVVGGSDVGVAMLAKHKEDQVHLTTNNDDYDILTVDSLGSLHVNAEAHHVFDQLDATTGWTELNDDTTGLTTTTKHVMGTAALIFNKANGTSNTNIACIQKTLSTTDLGSVSPHDILQGCFLIPDLTNVSYAFLRLGTSAAHYNEWRIGADQLTANIFETGALTIGDADYNGITGNGMDSSAITYIAVGVAFNSETDTLNGIIFDQISYHTNQHTSTSINSEVSSSVSSANVNISKIANKTANTDKGASGTGTMRVAIADDDTNLSPIKTAVELIDDVVYTDSDAFTATTSKLALTGGVYSVTPRTVTDGDIAPFAMDVNGHMITSAHAKSIALSDGVSNTANILVDEADAFMGSANFNFVYNGSTWDRMQGSAADGMLVNLGSNNDVTVSGTVTANLSNTDNTVLDSIQTAVEQKSTLYKNLDVDESEDQIKGTAGKVHWIHAINTTASMLYLKFYNATAASVTVGTTTPDLTFPVPTSGDTNGAGFTLPIPVNGIDFSTAITVACTTGLADNNSGPPAANAMVLNLGYS